MDLKDKLLSCFPAFEGTIDVTDPVHDIRSEALKNFEAKGFPSKKEEAWKYTSLNSLQKVDFSIFPKAEAILEYGDVKNYFLQGVAAYTLVFVDGVYSASLSEPLHDGIEVSLMSSALTQPRYRQLVELYFNQAVSKTASLTSLNTAFCKEGAFIYIPKHQRLERPVQIVYLATGDEGAVMLQPRNLIVVEEGAGLQIIERHQSLTGNAVFTNAVTEIFAARNATIDYYKVQNDQYTASLIDSTYITQKDDSSVRVHTFSFGGMLTRNNLNFYQEGQGIHSTLKGVTILDEKQHVDHHTLVHHRQPHCESHQDYKGIFEGSATGVFNGKIIVDKIAQKTNAFQQNNTILRGDKASVNTKPQLEIFADDVKCSHGCTVGQLDREALFYMQSRGIPRKEAAALLMYAFAHNVLESVQISELKTRITKLIAEKLGV